MKESGIEADKRLNATASERFRMYLEDLREWRDRGRRAALEGGPYPPMIPPSPRRVSRDYWRERSGGRDE